MAISFFLLLFFFSRCAVLSEDLTSIKKIDSSYVIGLGDNNVRGLWLYKPYKMPDSTGTIIVQDRWLLVSKNVEYILYDDEIIIYRKTDSKGYNLITNRGMDGKGKYHKFKSKKQFNIYKDRNALKDSTSYLIFLVQ